MEQLNPEGPKAARRGVTMLYASLAIGVLRSVFQVQHLPEGASAGLVLMLAIPLFGILSFLAYMIGKGAGWPRVVFLVQLIINIPPFVRSVINFGASGSIAGLLGVVQMTVVAIALLILFREPASGWFQEIRAWQRVA